MIVSSKVYNSDKSLSTQPSPRFMSSTIKLCSQFECSKSVMKMASTKYQSSDFVIMEDVKGKQFDSVKFPEHAKPHLQEINFKKSLDRYSLIQSAIL